MTMTIYQGESEDPSAHPARVPTPTTNAAADDWEDWERVPGMMMSENPAPVSARSSSGAGMSAIVVPALPPVQTPPVDPPVSLSRYV